MAASRSTQSVIIGQLSRRLLCNGLERYLHIPRELSEAALSTTLNVLGGPHKTGQLDPLRVLAVQMKHDLSEHWYRSREFYAGHILQWLQDASKIPRLSCKHEGRFRVVPEMDFRFSPLSQNHDDELDLRINSAIQTVTEFTRDSLGRDLNVVIPGPAAAPYAVLKSLQRRGFPIAISYQEPTAVSLADYVEHADDPPDLVVLNHFAATMASDAPKLTRYDQFLGLCRHDQIFYVDKGRWLQQLRALASRSKTPLVVHARSSGEGSLYSREKLTGRFQVHLTSSTVAFASKLAEVAADGEPFAGSFWTPLCYAVPDICNVHETARFSIPSSLFAHPRILRRKTALKEAIKEAIRLEWLRCEQHFDEVLGMLLQDPDFMPIYLENFRVLKNANLLDSAA